MQPVPATRARVLAASRRPGRGAAWARQYEVAADDELSYFREYEHITLARVLLAEHAATGSTRSPADALSGSSTVCSPPLTDGGALGTVIELEVLRAIAYDATSDRAEALEALGHAVELAETDGWVRVFVDSAAAVTSLLRELAADSRRRVRVGPARCSDLRRDPSSRTSPHPPGHRARTATELVDPLSDRELDVLDFSAQTSTVRPSHGSSSSP